MDNRYITKKILITYKRNVGNVHSYYNYKLITIKQVRLILINVILIFIAQASVIN